MAENELEPNESSEKEEKVLSWMGNHQMEGVAAVLMLFGIIFSFYTVRWGGILVGLSLGIAFFEEIKFFLSKMRDFYPGQGLFKTMMVIGGAIYFIMALPFFIAALALGCVVRYFAK